MQLMIRQTTKENKQKQLEISGNALNKRSCEEKILKPCEISNRPIKMYAHLKKKWVLSDRIGWIVFFGKGYIVFTIFTP